MRRPGRGQARPLPCYGRGPEFRWEPGRGQARPLPCTKRVAKPYRVGAGLVPALVTCAKTCRSPLEKAIIQYGTMGVDFRHLNMAEVNVRTCIYGRNAIATG